MSLRRSSGATPGFGSLAQVGARVYVNTEKELATATDWTVLWDVEVFDEGGLWAVANDTRLTAPIPGIYVISGSVYWEESLANDPLTLRFRLNDTTDIHYDEMSNGGTNWAGQTGTCIYQLDADDYVEMIVKQASGSDATLDIRADHTWFSIAKL